ncbi:(4Fe-4S)-binding protein [Ancylomarina sp. DW003]|nr:(4Fe-4S)-binding protein [Ancylomarina sp. DW003]MDE5423427.1 (4Fe-4S)-binding protein [Ancylomarina sp. DW003]
MKNTKKEYSNGEITVVYETDLCIHSGECSRGLASVFQPGSQPWVKMDGASKEEIMQQVQKCPTKALSFYVNMADKEEKEQPIALESGLKVQVLSKGPLLVEGPITLTNTDGKREVRIGEIFFCRCGTSKNKPFCDGSHDTIDFDD